MVAFENETKNKKEIENTFQKIPYQFWDFQMLLEDIWEGKVSMSVTIRSVKVSKSTLYILHLITTNQVRYYYLQNFGWFCRL